MDKGRKVILSIGIGIGAVLVGVVGVVVFLVVVVGISFASAIVPQVAYHPYTRSELKSISKFELVYPGSAILQQKIQNPNPFDEYETGAYIIELPKNVNYAQYLTWLSQNTANARWNTPTSWTDQSLSTYPDEHFQDDKDGIDILVNTRIEFFQNESYANGWSALYNGVDPDNAPYQNFTVYRGSNGGLVLWVRITADVWEGGYYNSGATPPPPIPVNTVFSRIP